MNIKVLQLFFLLITFNVISQAKKEYVKAKVSYGIDIFLDKNNSSYKRLEEYTPGISALTESVASELDYTLVFNDSTSIFYLEKKLFSDNYAAHLAIAKSKYYGRIKQLANHYITEELQEAFGKFLVSRPYQKWELLEESKVIDDYMCFKATTFYTVTNPKGKVFTHHFTAWYTPQLPNKFGPAGYGNLPGLIIELQGEEFSYGVKKIQFYDNNLETKDNEMPTLKKFKLINEEKFEAMAAKDEKRWRDKHD